MINIAVLASGEGTNLQALLDAAAARRIPGRVALVVSNKPGSGALRRAEKAGVPTLCASPKDHASPEAYDAFLASELKKRGVDLVCLAGFLMKLKDPMLSAFPSRILNIHPALLPAFGGQGMYGAKVHEAVLRSGAQVSGCTVHFVDAVYDHGPIAGQAAVPVLPDDTPETLAQRVLAQEHWLYPECVRLFAEGRLSVSGSRVRVKPAHDEGSGRLKRALISVSDKAGVVEFAKGLRELGVEIVSTSGTAKALREAGVDIRPLESLTAFPEILGGRVKTLHPRVHGGILLRRKDAGQAAEAAQMAIEPIDLVAVNLYPFERTAAKAPSPYAQEVIEDIDIGGVALIRAAAKNFEDVAVVVRPEDYAAILAELSSSSGRLTLETRRGLALSAFKHTSGYDTAIARAWNRTPTAAPGFPETLRVELKKVQDLRYGENPHQKAALYARGEASFEQLQGKELSYNNLLDAFGTWDAVSDFPEPSVVVFKHVTPSGIGTGRTLLEAFERAWACDPTSAFGGVLAANVPVTEAMASALGKRFVEVISAPAFEPAALEILAKKQNLRLLRMKAKPGKTHLLRSLGEEVLVTEPDRAVDGPEFRVVTKRAPTKDEERALRFAWAAAKHVKSNAIVLANPEATVGIGAGQMSRVDSAKMAALKYADYRKANPAPAALALASDAFFPFRDGLDEAAKTGATAVIQPGGSVRDAEVIAAADERGLAMVLTGMRHFRH